MLFMIIEQFRNRDHAPVGARFQAQGRMLPDGVAYQASWIDPQGARCFQIMEAASEELLDRWMRCWNDLVDFEVIPVLTSSEFWQTRPPTDTAAQSGIR
jgi:Domain of unknown function (DUF3303)